MGPSERTIRIAAAAGSWGAAALHFAAVEPHRHGWALAAAFMGLAGLAQFAWGVAVVGGRSNVVAGWGLWLHGSIVVVWLTSRTTGLPIGPHAWIPEHIHEADALATLLEVIAIVAVIALMRGWVIAPLARVAGAAAAMTLIVSGHDPVRERATALATLALATVITAWVSPVRRMSVVKGRKHEAQDARTVAVGVLVGARAGFGARG